MKDVPKKQSFHDHLQTCKPANLQTYSTKVG